METNRALRRTGSLRPRMHALSAVPGSEVDFCVRCVNRSIAAKLLRIPTMRQYYAAQERLSQAHHRRENPSHVAQPSVPRALQPATLLAIPQRVANCAHSVRQSHSMVKTRACRCRLVLKVNFPPRNRVRKRAVFRETVTPGFFLYRLGKHDAMLNHNVSAHLIVTAPP